MATFEYDENMGSALERKMKKALGGGVTLHAVQFKLETIDAVVVDKVLPNGTLG